MGVLRGAARLALLDDLERRFADLQAPVLVRIEGPAGSGRTRFVEELYERLVRTQPEPYWPSLDIAHRQPRSARDLQESRRVELAPAQLEGLSGVLPGHLWLAANGTIHPSLFRERSFERGDVLATLDAQLESHFGPLLRNIESRFGASEARRIGRFALNFIPGLSALVPLLEAGDLRDLVSRLSPSRSERSSRSALAATDAVQVDADASSMDRAERIAQAIVSLAGEKGVPTLLALDDAELADASAVHILTQVLRSSSRVMIVATTRAEAWDGLEGRSPFDLLVEDLRERRPARLREEALATLDPDAMREIVLDRVPGALGVGVSQVLGAAGDNPLVLDAILVQGPVQRALLEGDAIPERLIESLPRSVESVFGAMWETLSQEVREAFALVSLQGNPFDPEWVKELPGGVGDGLLQGDEEHGLIDFEAIGTRLLGWFTRSWVQLRARESLRTECDDRLLLAAIAAYLRSVEVHLNDPSLPAAPPRVLRALLGAYVALGVGDAIVAGRHPTTELDRAAMLLAGAEERLGRVDVALGVLHRVRRAGTFVRREHAADWALLEARLERRLGRPSEGLAALDAVEAPPDEHALAVLMERIRCSVDARVPVDVGAMIERIGAELQRPDDSGRRLSPEVRLEAFRVLAHLAVDSETTAALALLEELAASQEPHLGEVELLRMRSGIAGANARAGHFRRARDLWLSVESAVHDLDPSVARIPGFRGSYASWLPVVGEFRLGVEIMRETWERNAEFLSSTYPSVLTGRQNLIYWLVEGGDMDAAEAAAEYAAIAERMRVTMEPNHPVLTNVRINHALMLIRSGAYDEAQTALDALRSEAAVRPMAVSRLDRYESELRAGLGDIEAARALARSAHLARYEALGPTAWRTQEALCARVRVELPDLALELIEEALSVAGPLDEALNPAVIRLMGERARIRRDVPELERVLARQEELLGAGHEDAVRSRADLVELTGRASAPG
jgi:hypothetical protein